MNVFGKAKDAKDAVAERAAALKEQAGGLASDLKDQAGSAVASVAAAGLDRAQSTLADLNATLPMLKAAGYTLSGVDVEIGLSPKVQATFTTEGAPLTEERVDEIVRANEDKKLAVVLLKALAAASRMQARVTVGALKPVGLAVQIGLSPAVVIKFN